MGHFLSRKGSRLNAERSRRRRSRPLGGKVQPPRSRSCFLRGPCMLCFLVHSSASPPAAEEPPQLPSQRDSPLLYAALRAPEGERAARRLLRLSPVAAACEERCRRCRRWLLSGLVFSLPARRGFLGPALQGGEAPPEMVCKRKGVGLPACPPCKQPRCGPGTGTGGSSSPPPEARQQSALPEQHLCALPCASACAREEVSSKEPAGQNADGKGPAPPGSPSSQQQQHQQLPPELGGRETQEPREPDCEEPPENPGDCLREPQPPSPDINQLPPSILLKIFSNLSLNERCLSASLVCKYWRDLCLDFQFWKQLDLSSRQQVTDELLEKIASRSQNITEINISDCRNVSDTGVCVLASKCPGLLRYTAYRCKQLSDTSLIAVASQCPQLQKVHVGNQDRLTDEGLKQLGSECRELKDIHFGQCYKISDEGMIIIAKGCLKLQRIYMQENKLVTDQSVKAFAEHCPELQYVGFMGCSVTSKGVIHLTNLRNLSSLDLRHITELDNETVMEIVKRCRNLTSLNLCLNWIINDRLN
ncbi:F-box/LRR-repeat protein 17 isoform X2 [Hemicordylus capensis]|uniref:F-box/LRR-repeat protein 17 isoform X2 n=1 Tax=Hemicordylus capensis TaxID=884348 RepID=UPI0023032FC2|nr:F-box/LRR-repeat protein 17 isoform X2 [Hemicordylus capensis]